MKRVFDHIQDKSREFTQRPLFVYLKDESLSPRDRLQFIPHIAHFVMTFADLYHFFLTTDEPKDEYEVLANTHLSEEGSHWKWYLKDLTELDLDPSLRLTDTLRFIWGDSTINTRRLAYEICKMTAGMDSLEKLVMIQAIEATGRVGLEASVPTGNKVKLDNGRSLIYFGGHHLDTERQHTVEQDDVHSSLLRVALDDAKCQRLCAIVDDVFARFQGFVDETFELAVSKKGFPADRPGKVAGPAAAAPPAE